MTINVKVIIYVKIIKFKIIIYMIIEKSVKIKNTIDKSEIIVYNDV